MQRILMKSKIHRATVTRADLDYEGSCSLGSELLAASGIAVGEQVHIVNVTNGSRAVTYAIEGTAGEVSLNGAMAHIGSPGDIVIVIAYANVEEAEVGQFRPRIVHVGDGNRVLEGRGVN
ncbi:MAG: aspartate 1-decarboxylase [Candidatus Dormibacteria bacterium]